MQDNKGTSYDMTKTATKEKQEPFLDYQRYYFKAILAGNITVSSVLLLSAITRVLTGEDNKGANNDLAF